MAVSVETRASAARDGEIAARISQRRRQILVHSAIYYHLDDNVVSDHVWSRWAAELCEMQEQYPEIAEKCPWHEAFRDFDGSTGFNLPLKDPWVMGTAKWLLSVKGESE